MLRRDQFLEFLAPEGRLAPGGFAESFEERLETVLFQTAAHGDDSTSNPGRDFMRLTEREIFDTHQRIRQFRAGDAERRMFSATRAGSMRIAPMNAARSSSTRPAEANAS
jgi:hypothetical protein